MAQIMGKGHLTTRKAPWTVLDPDEHRYLQTKAAARAG